MGLDGAAAATADDGVLPGGLASLVRDGRQAARLTQLQLAAAAGVSIGVVRDLEQGRTARPRQRSVTRIAAALGVPADLTAPGSAGPPRGVRLQVLGSLAAWRDGEEVALGPARERAVLGLLAARPNSVVRREAICEALWDGGPPATALAMVQSYVGRLRRLLGPPRGPGGAGGLLLATGSGYRLQVTHEQLDLIEFTRVCARAREAARAGRHEVACARYEEALALWQGEPLADIDALRGHPAVSGLARQWAAAVEDYAGAVSAQGWHSRALGRCGPWRPASR
jgi:transcriptional regulator with XRE-family HTH domain